MTLKPDNKHSNDSAHIIDFIADEESNIIRVPHFKERHFKKSESIRVGVYNKLNKQAYNAYHRRYHKRKDVQKKTKAYFCRPNVRAKLLPYMRAYMKKRRKFEKHVLNGNSCPCCNCRSNFILGSSPDYVWKECLLHCLNSIERAALNRDLDEIALTHASKTEKMILMQTRIGQGTFRKQVLKICQEKCVICSLEIVSALTAGHIKPWAKATNLERLDPHNGFALCPDHDYLFGRFQLTVLPNGRILFSKVFNAHQKMKFRLQENMAVNIPMLPGHRTFLKYHNHAYFKAESDAHT